MNVRTVSFYSEGSRLVADYYLPRGAQADRSLPGIVLCHGYAAVRKLVLPDYAKLFAAAGFATVAFDFRGFGDSEGPKWRVIASEQVQDIRNAITWLEAQPEVNPQRLGIWGTSNGGAHVVTVAGLDGRVKCAVGQVGYGEGRRMLLDNYSPEERERYLAKVREDRTKRVLTGKGESVPVEELIYSPTTKAFHLEAIKADPQWDIRLAWESAEATLEYRPIDYAHQIAPRALMLIGAEQDDFCW
ncbi:MAG: alpha/beta fold hydrolase, partial [Peristeroidobacter soli]